MKTRKPRRQEEEEQQQIYDDNSWTLNRSCHRHISYIVNYDFFVIPVKKSKH